jgi:hypothetical protein
MIYLLILIFFYTEAKLHCPKYHYEIDASCYLYYLENRTLAYSINFCGNFSNNLISLETDSKWKGFISHLNNNFNLTNYKFKISIDFDQTKNYWYWSNLKFKVNNSNWCSNKLTEYNNDTQCIVLMHKNDSWCLQTYSCLEETAFICEWKPKENKKFNKRLENLLENVFYYFILFAIICLIFLFLFFIQFYFYQNRYLKLYVDRMDEIAANKDADLIYFKKLI